MWRHCFRSTLADFIFENEVQAESTGLSRSARFEDDFRSSFVRDIIRVCVGNRSRLS